MALNADQIRVALTGAAYVAPKGTTAPTDATTAWTTGWVDLGWLDENGIEENYADDVKEIKGFQGGQTVRKLITGSDATLKFTCIETSKAVLELYHKGSTIATATGKHTLSVKGPKSDVRAFGFDVIDGDKHTRIVVPSGEVTERGAIVYKGDEAIGYELTVTAYPGSDGTVLIKLSDDPAWTTAGS